MAGGESLPRTFVGLVYTHICKSALRGSAEERRPGAPPRLATVTGWLLIKELSAEAQRQNSSQGKVTCNDDPSRWI